MDEKLKLWREKVLLRDNFTCKRCKKRLPKHKLQAHHIKSQTSHPELKYIVSNGETLCYKCHSKEKSSKTWWHLKGRYKSIKRPKKL